MSTHVPWIRWTALAIAFAASAGAENRCVLETDGVEHALPNIYVAREEAFVAESPQPVSHHWVFCTRHPVEPNPALGDWLVATRMAILQLDEDDRVEVQVAHDGGVRRVGMSWGNLQADSPLDDPDLPVRFEGTMTEGRAQGRVITAAPMKTGPMPAHDAEVDWQISITLDAPILGAEP